MTLKDAGKIKEAIKKIAPVLARSDDIIKVIDSVPEVVISTDTDTISRKAVTDAIEKCHKRCCREDATGDEWIHYETTLNEVESIPPAQPESDSGRWEKLQPVFAEIAEEYKKACKISYINKPLAHALYEVWKKHDRRDTNRNE